MLYTAMVKLLHLFLQDDYEPDAEMLDLVRTIGKRGEVPQELIDALDVVEFRGATLH